MKFEVSLEGNLTVVEKGLTVPADAELLVQIAWRSNSYRTRWSFKASNIGIALRYFHSVNIGNGYRKRLYLPEHKLAVAREIS